MTNLRTRLAPSPTGHLHLGHVLHIIYVQGLATRLGASISFRLEDHDRSRCRPEFETSIIRDLNWLGLALPNPPRILWRQSERHQVYQRHLENLMSRNLIYACSCSRKDIQVETSRESGELRYPGTCRTKRLPLDAPGTSLRLMIPDELQTFNDLFLGATSDNPATQCGDVVVRDRNGHWTYQFAVVIDDLEQGINLIIRGMDLLSSTARQIAMRTIIDPAGVTPDFAHHPLIKNPEGHKLSKRIYSEAISKLRDDGKSPARIPFRQSWRRMS